jgi:hypothetical protein
MGKNKGNKAETVNAKPETVTAKGENTMKNEAEKPAETVNLSALLGAFDTARASSKAPKGPKNDTENARAEALYSLLVSACEAGGASPESPFFQGFNAPVFSMPLETYLQKAFPETARPISTDAACGYALPDARPACGLAARLALGKARRIPFGLLNKGLAVFVSPAKPREGRKAFFVFLSGENAPLLRLMTAFAQENPEKTEAGKEKYTESADCAKAFEDCAKALANVNETPETLRILALETMENQRAEAEVEAWGFEARKAEALAYATLEREAGFLSLPEALALAYPETPAV